MKNKPDMYNTNGELTLLLNSYNTIITGAYSINPVYKKSSLKFFVEGFDKLIKDMEESEKEYHIPVETYELDEIKYSIETFINREEITPEQLKIAQAVITEMFLYKYSELSNTLFNTYNEFLSENVYAK